MKCGICNIANVFFSIYACSNRRKVKFVYPSCLHVTPVQLQDLNLFTLTFRRKRVSRQKNGFLASCHNQSKQHVLCPMVPLWGMYSSGYTEAAKVLDTAGSLCGRQRCYPATGKQRTKTVLDLNIWEWGSNSFFFLPSAGTDTNV